MNPDFAYEPYESSCGNHGKTEKVTFLITVAFRPECATSYAINDHLTDVIDMHGVKSVTSTPVPNKTAKIFRKLLGF